MFKTILFCALTLHCSWSMKKDDLLSLDMQLITAIWSENKKEIKQLLDAKANPNYVYLRYQTNNQTTPLVRACSPGWTINTCIISLLLEKNANPNQVGYGQTFCLGGLYSPLMWVCLDGDGKDALKMLLDNGANPFQKEASNQHVPLDFCSNVSTAQEFIRYIKNVLDMNLEEKIKYLCKYDKKFKLITIKFLLSLKNLKKRVPKYLIFIILFDYWMNNNQEDYRHILWSCENKSEFLGNLVKNNNLTLLTLSRVQEYNIIALKDFYEKFEKIRLEKNGYEKLDTFLSQSFKYIVIVHGITTKIILQYKNN